MEAFGYRDVLEDILAFSGGKRLLTAAEVGVYTGISDPRTVKRRYPRFKDGKIAAPVLARLMCGGEKE